MGSVGHRILTFDNSIYRTALLTESAVDTLGHVDIVSGCSSTSIDTLFSFNRDGLSRADGFTEFTGNASFFPRGISTESVLATEAGGDGAFLEGVEDGVSNSWSARPLAHDTQPTIDQTIDPIYIAGYRSMDIKGRYIRRSEELFQHHIHAPEQLRHEEVLGSAIERGLILLVPSLWGSKTEA